MVISLRCMFLKEKKVENTEGEVTRIIERKKQSLLEL